MLSKSIRAGLLVAASSIYASPLPVPQNSKVFSPNHSFFAISLVKEKRTSIYRTDHPAKPVWELSLYSETPNLANDGMHLAISYDHGNILDNDVRPTDPLITFYNSGGTKVVLSVQDVLGDFRRLGHSSDGWTWGRVTAFNKTGLLLIDLDDGRTLSIDPDHPQPKPAGRWHK